MHNDACVGRCNKNCASCIVHRALCIVHCASCIVHCALNQGELQQRVLSRNHTSFPFDAPFAPPRLDGGATISSAKLWKILDSSKSANYFGQNVV